MTRSGFNIYIYIYIYIHNHPHIPLHIDAPTNIHIHIRSFGGQAGNRFVSFVRASGRGEAKLRGRARGVSILVLGLFWGKCPPAPAKPGRGGVRKCFDV